MVINIKTSTRKKNIIFKIRNAMDFSDNNKKTKNKKCVECYTIANLKKLLMQLHLNIWNGLIFRIT